MAKELPYFKFEPNQWENGNIQMCSREDKGLFLDICSIYWSRLGELPEKLVIQKLCGGNASALSSLIEENIIAIEDGYICIDFLNEQLLEFKKTSDQNSLNAKKRWKKNALASKPHSEIDTIREDKRREEEIREEKKRQDEVKQQEKVEVNNTLMSEIKISDVEDEVLKKYFEIAEAFRKLFIKNQKEKDAPTKHQDSAKFKNYVNPIRLMMENDGVTKEQLTSIFKFLDSPKGEFWKSNILSTEKLRKQLTQLIMKSKENLKPNESYQFDPEKVFKSDAAKNFSFNDIQ